MSKIIKYCLGSEYSDQELLKDALWKIWQDIFHDTDEYLTLFFKDKYHSDRVYLACQEEKISSCVHSVDYKFNLFGQVIDSTYTTAGATLPAYRGQGIYDNLFDYCLNQMVNHNIVLTTLIIQDDWLFNFYKRLGYSDVFKKKQTQLYPSKSGTYIETYSHNELYDYYKKNLLSAQFRAIHSQPDFDTVLKYLVIDDGCAFVAYDSNKKNITGVAFVIIENNNLLILDMICNDQESQDNLVNQICTKYNVASVKWMSNSNEAGANSYGMIRIINLPRFLDICAAKYFNLQLQLSVFDSIVKNNSGTYTLNDGLCSYSADINNALSIDQVLPFLFKEIEKQCGDKIDAAISLMLE